MVETIGYTLEEISQAFDGPAAATYTLESTTGDAQERGSIKEVKP